MNPSNEPVGWGGALTALAVAAIPLLRAFGVDVTEDQSSALLGFLAAVIGIGTLVVRSKVTPVATAEKAIDRAWLADPTKDLKPQL